LIYVSDKQMMVYMLCIVDKFPDQGKF